MAKTTAVECSSILLQNIFGHIAKTQRIQNCAARLARRTPKFDRILNTYLQFKFVCTGFQFVLDKLSIQNIDPKF